MDPTKRMEVVRPNNSATFKFFVLLMFLATAYVGFLVCGAYYRSEMEVSGAPASASSAHKTPSIFFLETSGVHNQPSLRQTCSIESTARANPDMPIDIMMTSPFINMTGQHMECLQKFKNVRFSHLDTDSLFLNSPLNNWYRNGHLHRITDPAYKIAVLSDAARLILLFNQGGIYLDLDNIVVRSLSELRNTLGVIRIEIIKRSSINNSVMIFDRGHWFIARCLLEWERIFDPQGRWGLHGPGLLTLIMNLTCPLPADQQPSLPYQCHGVTVLGHEAFNPANPYSLLLPGHKGVTGETLVAREFSASYMIHMTHVWSNQNLHLIKGSGQAADGLVRSYCPCVHDLVGPQGTSY